MKALPSGAVKPQVQMNEGWVDTWHLGLLIVDMAKLFDALRNVAH